MINTKNKKPVSYIGMPLLFTILGFLVLYTAGMPVFAIVKSYGNMVIIKGAPGYSNKFDPEISRLVLKKEAGKDEYKIQVPALETHFANIKCVSISLEAPVYYGDSERVLAYGAGMYVPSGLPGAGKPVLIGGHDLTCFGSLEKIKPGDEVEIETNYGIFKYKVTETKIAYAADTTAYDLTQEKEQLILYTCYPFGKVTGQRNERYFVYCDRVIDTAVPKEQQELN